MSQKKVWNWPIFAKLGVQNSDFVFLQQAWETLKDPELRKRYDAQYARTQTLAGVARVSAEIDLEEMQHDPTEAVFRSPCRCGSMYEITEAQLEDHVELVFCSGCTLQIRVLYELQEEDWSHLGWT